MEAGFILVVDQVTFTLFDNSHLYFIVKDISQILQMNKQNIPMIPVVVCLFGYFGLTASFTVFETIGTLYTKEAYFWSVSKNSALYAALGKIFLCFHDNHV